MGLRDTLNAVRRNHGLEHATIAVLLSRRQQSLRLVSRAVPDGFYVYADVSSAELDSSAREALDRMQRGEAHLAVSALCGTNLAVAGILSGLTAVALIGDRNRFQRLPTVLTGTVLAMLAAQPLGRLTQKYVTTDADLSGFEVVGVSERGKGRGRYYKVETVRRAA